MTALAMFLKPFLMLAFFACIVIPLRLLLIRAAPPSWRAVLLQPTTTAQQAVAVFGVFLIAAIAGLLIADYGW